jgi:hypothetical protein
MNNLYLKIKKLEKNYTKNSLFMYIKILIEFQKGLPFYLVDADLFGRVVRVDFLLGTEKRDVKIFLINEYRKADV